MITQISPAFPDSIETPRLKLRAPELSDAERMFSSYTQDADVARYMVWQPHASLETTRDFIADCVAQWNAGLALPYIITLKASDEFIGMLEARPRDHIVNIGYLLARNHWGQGLMVEAIQAFTAIALRLPGIFRVEATCDVDNRRSARALEKSGFLLEGRLARYTLLPNISTEPRDCFIYAACRP
jgi:ribosomal-protein-alanine N-acetyltransferase